MMSLPRLVPGADPAWVSPADAAIMVRTNLEQTRMIGYSAFNIDAVTTVNMGIYGARPSVRHRSGCSDAILRFLQDAGLQIDEDIHIFDTGAEAEALADRLIAEGHRLMSIYPLPEGRYADAAMVVANPLWRRLNAKRNLPHIVPAAHLAAPQLLSHAALSQTRFTHPVCLKYGGQEATGWGHSVRICRDAKAFDEARAWFSQATDSDEVIMEEACDVLRCWCANIAVTADSCHYLGAAEQMFASEGHQSGSMIDPAQVFPAEGIAMALQVGEAARALGYVGIAGLDIGLTRDGRLIVFDPNFRSNACSVQILMYPAAVARSGLAASISVSATTSLPIAKLLARLERPVQEGWFMPLRLLDGTLLAAADGKCLYTGFAMGKSRNDALARAAELTALIEAR